MEVDQGSFTPLVFTVAEGMGGEGRAFYQRPATLLSLKDGIEKCDILDTVLGKFCTTQNYVVVFTRLMTKVSK